MHEATLLNKKLFPVGRPDRFKRANWDFFSLIPLYIIVKKKKKKKKKHPTEWPFFGQSADRKRFFTSGWPDRYIVKQEGTLNSHMVEPAWAAYLQEVYSG